MEQNDILCSFLFRENFKSFMKINPISSYTFDNLMSYAIKQGEDPKAWSDIYKSYNTELLIQLLIESDRTTGTDKNKTILSKNFIYEHLS